MVRRLYSGAMLSALVAGIAALILGGPAALVTVAMPPVPPTPPTSPGGLQGGCVVPVGSTRQPDPCAAPLRGGEKGLLTPGPCVVPARTGDSPCAVVPRDHGQLRVDPPACIIPLVYRGQHGLDGC
jgi:hypothetical protein